MAWTPPDFVPASSGGRPPRVMSLRRPQLESLLRTDPEIAYHAMRAIIRTAHAIQHRLSVQSVELANHIYKQHGRYGTGRAA